MPSLPRPIPRANVGLSDPRPTARANVGLTDPRSTGATPPGRVRDILAIHGTMKTRS